MFKPVFLITTLSAGIAFAGAHMPLAIHTMDTASGAILTDDAGMTLYTFDNDTNGVSNCAGGCAEKWPPLVAADGAAGTNDYSVITRADGAHQWAYRGMPLYTWFQDHAVGDMTGDGVKGVWHVARP